MIPPKFVGIVFDSDGGYNVVAGDDEAIVTDQAKRLYHDVMSAYPDELKPNCFWDVFKTTRKEATVYHPFEGPGAVAANAQSPLNETSPT